MTQIAETAGLDATLIVLEGFTALAIAVLVVGLCAVVRGDRTGLPAIPLFFVVLFLAAWAGGSWGVRLLPKGWGTLFWAPYLVTSLVAGTLLMAGARLPVCGASIEKVGRQGGTGSGPRLTIVDASLWTLGVALAVAVVVHYTGRFVE